MALPFRMERNVEQKTNDRHRGSGPLSRALVPLYPGKRLPLVVALAGYFDDSKNANEGIFAVAGYLSTVELWDEGFAPAWQAVLDSAPHPLAEFKAADCRHKCEQFEGWTKSECDAITERFVSVIVGQAIPDVVGIGAAVHIENFSEIPKEQRDRFERFAYLLCFGAVIHGVCQLSAKYVEDDDIRMIFDEQDELESRARAVFEDVRGLVPENLRSQVHKPLFEPSHRVLPLQAADLLAYETYKEMKNRAEIPVRPVSMALQRLVEGKLHAASYFGNKELIEIRQHIDSGAPLASGHYRLPAIYSSAMEQRIRAISGR